MLDAVCGFHVGMHAKAADDDPVLRFAQLGIIQLRLVVSTLQATLMVGLYAAFLTFGQFVLTH
ncbi:hypothetical protein D3C80_1584510 [compost metagenome]